MSNDSYEIKKARPLSPHLSIYKPQISSVLSIGHRLSGVGLFFALIIACWWFICWVFSRFDTSYLECLNHTGIKFLLFVTSFGYFYHFCTGVRHLIWDLGYCFSIKSINLTGWIAVVFSVILTVIYWLFM